MYRRGSILTQKIIKIANWAHMGQKGQKGVTRNWLYIAWLSRLLPTCDILSGGNGIRIRNHWQIENLTALKVLVQGNFSVLQNGLKCQNRDKNFVYSGLSYCWKQAGAGLNSPKQGPARNWTLLHGAFLGAATSEASPIATGLMKPFVVYLLLLGWGHMCFHPIKIYVNFDAKTF